MTRGYLLSTTLNSYSEESYYKIIHNSLRSSLYRTIDHAVFAFNLPTEYNAPGQENITDDDDKLKIKVDPMKMSLDDLTTKQLEEIVNGWMKFLQKAFRDAKEKVMAETLKY